MLGAWVLVIGVALIAAFDVYLKTCGRPTESTGLRRHPLLPFLFGVLVGALAMHLFGMEF
jgi:hypothetical protein